jgi:hypothetical protein
MTLPTASRIASVTRANPSAVSPAEPVGRQPGPVRAGSGIRHGGIDHRGLQVRSSERFGG